MLLLPEHLRLYLCADGAFCGAGSLVEMVEAAIAGGVTIVQLRHKEASSRQLYEEALELRVLTKKANIPLIINDRLDIALAMNADGVHLGQSDLPVAAARQIADTLRPHDKFIIGVSAHTAEEALAAERDGADYLGSGAVYPTGSKNDTTVIGVEGLKTICAAVKIPVIGIGGIGPQNAAAVLAAGAAGAAVISAILSAEDITKAARNLRRIIGD
ncbi:thiamine-phosphate synthase [Spirochaetia bacterium]|nr:thiamine-phosphate synthase [Spirochaetia bacterium]